MGPLSSDNHQRTHCTTPELFIDHHCKTQMRFLVIPPVNRSTGSNLMVNVCPAAGFNRATHKLVAINKARFWYFKAFLLLNGKYSVSFFIYGWKAHLFILTYLILYILSTPFSCCYHHIMQHFLCMWYDILCLFNIEPAWFYIFLSPVKYLPVQ